MSRSPRSPIRLRASTILLVLVAVLGPPAVVHGDGAFPVSPESIDLILAPGQTGNLSVSIAVMPQCFRPFLFDIQASDPTALVDNLTGPHLNGCGGHVSTFDVEFNGDVEDQAYDLEIVDVYFSASGPAVATIPVAIHRVPEPGFAGMVASGLVLLWLAQRRSGPRRADRCQPQRSWC